MTDETNAYIDVIASHVLPAARDAHLDVIASHVNPTPTDAYANVDAFLAADSPAPATSSYSDAVLADSPALYLKCQEASGTTLIDSSGNGRDATISGSGAFLRSRSEISPPDGLGYHINLDGTSGHIILPNTDWITAHTTGFSVEMWLYVRTYKANSKIFDFSNSAADDVWAGFNASPRMLYRSGGTTNTSPNVMDTGQWHHFAFTMNALGAMNTYIDGALYASASLGAPSNNGRQFKYIGRSNLVSGTNYLNAAVSHIAVYNGVLTQTQVLNHFHAARDAGIDYVKSVQADAPWGYWPLNEVSPSTVFEDYGITESRPLTLSGSLSAYAVEGPIVGSVGLSFPSNISAHLVQSSGPTYNSHTYEAWVKIPSNPTANCSIMSIGSSSGTSFTESGLWLDTSGRVNFSINNGSWQHLAAPSGLAANVWHHVVAIYSPTGLMTLRINKNTVGTKTVTPSTTTYSRQVRIRSGYNHSGGIVSISNPAFYKGALSTATTDAHYDATTFYDVTGTEIEGINVLPFDRGVSVYWDRPFAAADYEYRIDGGSPISTGSSDSYLTDFNISNGTHTIEVRIQAGPSTSDWSQPKTFTSTQTQSFLRQVLIDNPAMYFPLDNAGGNYTSWPRGFKASPGVGVYRTRAAITRNSSAAASGSGSSYIAQLVGGPAFPSDGTLEAWVRIPSGNVPINGTVMSVGGTSGNGYRISINSDRTVSVARNIGNSTVGTLTTDIPIPILTTAKTYHLVAKVSDTQFVLYIDGRMVSISGFASSGAPSIYTYTIGDRGSSTKNPLSSNVHVDSVAYYHYHLALGRILEHARAGFPAATPTNTKAYPLDGGAFVIHDYQPSAEYTEFTLDDGATYLRPDYEAILKMDHPVRYYRFEDATGSICTDSSKSAVNAQYVGDYSLDQDGALHADVDTASNKCFYTPGTGGVKIPAATFPDLTQGGLYGFLFTFEAWIKPDEVEGIQTIFSRSDYSLANNSTNRAFSVHLNDNILQWEARNILTDRGYQASTPIPAGEWTHIVVNCEREINRIYINGVEESRTYSFASFSQLSNVDAYIGMNQDATRNFKGYIDEAAIYDYAMTPEQVWRHYIAGKKAKHYQWAVIPELENDEEISVRASTHNSYVTSTGLTPETRTTPNSDRYLTVLDRFDGAFAYVPGHPQYGADRWTITNMAYPLRKGPFGSIYHRNSADQACLVESAGPKFDITTTLATASSDTGGFYAGTTGRRVSNTRNVFWGHTVERVHQYVNTGSAISPRPITLQDKDVMRYVSDGTDVYLLRNGELIHHIEDPQYSENPSWLASLFRVGMQFFGLTGGVSFEDFVAYNKPPEDLEITYSDVGDDAFLYKGRVSRTLDAPTYEP